MKRIAVIGSGISGLSAAWALKDSADVTVFESSSRPGGHAHTVNINYDGHPISLDVGFIVCNPLNYPNFMAFMDAIGVPTIESDMSFAVSDPEGFEWSSNRHGLFAYKRNLFRPSYLKLLRDILRFNKQAITDVEANAILSDQTLGDYLEGHGFNESFSRNYILPMGAAIWSTPEAEMADYPALSFLNFFNNHRLLHHERPKWRTVKNGSQSYVNALTSELGGLVRVSSPVERITRTDGGVKVHLTGDVEAFDDVILACHADEAQKLLGDGFEHQASVLAPFKFTNNTAYLHSDTSLMPKRKAAWASWNVLKGHGEAISLSYWMNKLQAISDDFPLFVTLNPEREPMKSKTFGRFEFTHPMFNLDAAETVEKLKRLNGRDGLWFAGAWMGHGFHEDGLKSGLSVALSLGGSVPWEPVGITIYGAKRSLESDQTDHVQVAAL